MIDSAKVGDEWVRIDMMTEQQLVTAIAHYTNEILIDRAEITAMPRVSTVVHPLDLVLNCFTPNIEEGDSGWRRTFDETVANYVAGCLRNLEILDALACEAILRNIVALWVSQCLQRARNRYHGNRVPLAKTEFVEVPESYR